MDYARVCRLLLLTIPFPSLLLNKGIVGFGDLVFSIRVGTLRIFSIITVISFIVLVGACVSVVFALLGCYVEKALGGY